MSDTGEFDNQKARTNSQASPDPALTWSTYHLLAVDATKVSSQSQTASLPVGKGACRIYATGDTVDNTYRLLALIGSGGMGVVFHCQHLILGKEYALKLLSADNLSGEVWLRFQSEAKALARMHHSGVVGIHNMGIDKGECPYYVMDLLDGNSLAQIIQTERRIAAERAVGLFLQVADALGAAHEQGIIHRDIKPSNIMVLKDRSRGELTKLVDFGIARLSNKGYGKQFETIAGSVFGTPYYMSPEQGLGRPVDERSDIYSLGCALFEALSGVPPLCGGNAMETMMLHQSKDAPTLNETYGQGQFSAALEAVVARMLQKDPGKRYQNMAQLIHDLKRAQAGKMVGTVRSENQDDSSVEIAQKFKDRLIEPLTSDKSVSNESSAKSLALVIGVVSLLIFGGLTGFYLLMQNQSVDKNARAPGKSSEIMSSLVVDDDRIAKAERLFKEHYKNNAMFCRHVTNKDGLPIKQFVFPSAECHVGYLSVNGGPVIKAAGLIDVPTDASVTLYLQCVCTPYPEIIDKFADGDLTGLEIVTFKPEVVMPKLKNWKSLKHLSFFNSIERQQGIDCSTVSRDDVAQIDTFVGLKSLGLCGELKTMALGPDKELLGANVASMRLLDKIDNLMLKEIKQIQPVLADLHRHSNIKSLTLDLMDLTDKDLDLLSNAQSLESVTIYKCPQITERTAATFSKLKNLKQLHIDIKWPDAVQKHYKSLVPGYSYENYKTNTHY